MQPICSNPPGLHRLLNELLLMIIHVLPLSSIATLALARKQMFHVIGDFSSPFAALDRPGNEVERAKFLLLFDALYPTKKLCFACGGFHPRYIHTVANAPMQWTKKRVLVEYKCALERMSFKGGIRIEDKIWRWCDFHLIMRGLRHSLAHGDLRNLIPYHPPDRQGAYFEVKWAKGSLHFPY
jgi:hypothetical protein